MKIAILDDYQNVALEMADWTDLKRRAEITVFNDHISDFDALVRRLEPFDVICVMRERTPIRRTRPACWARTAGGRRIDVPARAVSRKTNWRRFIW